MQRTFPGWFISFEGIEGCGKSTHVALLRDWFEEKGFRVLLAREPGGTIISEKIRGILLDPNHSSMDHRTELLLYLASRSQVVEELLLPALKSGVIVLIDRYVDSTMAYQGYGRGLDVESIRLINSFASRDLQPDLTVLLDLDPAEGLRRKGGDDKTTVWGDRLEREDLSFHEKIREGFLSIARDDSERVVIVRVDREIKEVQEEIRNIVAGRFSL